MEQHAGVVAAPYTINEIRAGIIGEGTLAGAAAVIIRVQGCNVACPFCDSRQTWHLDTEQFRAPQLPGEWRNRSVRWTRLTALAIGEHVAELAGPGTGWVLLTGGEPALQPLEPLVRELHGRGLKVALETSGTADGFIGAGVDWVTVSPKIGMPGLRAFNPDTLRYANEVRSLVGRDKDVARIRELYAAYGGIMGERLPRGEMCEHTVQPVSLSAFATGLCAELVQAHGFRLSPQIGKILNLAGA